MGSSCFSGSLRIVAVGILLTGAIVFGLSNVEMNKSASTLVYNSAAPVRAAAEAQTTTVRPAVAGPVQSSATNSPDIRVILALK